MAVRTILATAVVVLLVGGWTVATTDRHAAATGVVQGFFDTGDAAGLVTAIVPETLPGQAPRQVLVESLQATLDAGHRVVDSGVIHARGVALERTETSDGLVWCTRPDGRVLVECRIGATTLTPGSSRGDVVDITGGRVDLLPTRTVVNVFLAPRQGRGTTLLRPFQLVGAEGEVLARPQQVELLRTDTRRREQVAGNVEFAGTIAGAIIRFEVDAEHTEAVTARSLTVRFGGGDVSLRVAQPRYLIP